MGKKEHRFLFIIGRAAEAGGERMAGSRAPRARDFCACGREQMRANNNGIATMILGSELNGPRKILAGILSLGLSAAALAADEPIKHHLAAPTGLRILAQTPPPAESAGWTGITPSADLQGWTRIAIPPTNPLGRAQWRLDAARQVLVCDGDGGHDLLRFDRPLTNGTFHVEYRFLSASGPNTNYNSGIFIRNSADGTIWHQCQLALDGGYLFGETPVGDQLTSFKSPASEQRMKPVGEWNTVEVSAQGRRLTVWLNGAEVSQFSPCEQPAGYIALEAEGYAIEFRNLRLKPLP